MEVQELKSTVDSINRAMSELKNDLDAKLNKDALDQTKLDKLTEEITKKMEVVAEAERKAEAREKAFEAMMNRIDLGQDKKATPEIIEKSQKAFDTFLRKGQIGDGFKNLGDGSRPGVEIRSMSTNVNPDGGYMVMPELANFMVTRAFETSPLRQVARVVTTGAKSIEVLVDDDESTATWTNEGSVSSNTDTPQVGRKEITAHKLDAEPRVTIEMLEDAYLDVESWLRDKAADKFGRTENTAFISGNGVGRPRGILDYSTNWAVAGTYQRDRLEQIISGSAAAITADGLINLQNALKEVYQPRATFLMKRQTFGAVLRQKGNDNYFFSPVLLKDGQAQMQLLGKRVLFCDDMPVVAASALAIAYGDFSTGYTIVDRVGLQVLRDPFTNKGFMTFYMSKRVGGDVTNFDAIKLQVVSA